MMNSINGRLVRFGSFLSFYFLAVGYVFSGSVPLEIKSKVTLELEIPDALHYRYFAINSGNENACVLLHIIAPDTVITTSATTLHGAGVVVRPNEKVSIGSVTLLDKQNAFNWELDFKVGNEFTEDEGHRCHIE